MWMDQLEAFFACCARVLDGDAALIAQLRARGFACEAGDWRFSLPAVHAFLGGRDEAYPGWLKRLYASDFNTRLRALGGEIVIVDNHGKVDRNLYSMRRIE
ncbi:MAG: hypothetical protein DI599_00955 [Pseudomonas kuykendallii]|uniref:Uncharacterized protein n=2 Tax=Pseudomonas TaxID=286 RepID=A0A2W5DAJ2_9PSED|nr:MAG: hypothetical protein DI599_00955 [Pseudomonas kuykendallii]